jgi:hypothetical protein
MTISVSTTPIFGKTALAKALSTMWRQDNRQDFHDLVNAAYSSWASLRGKYRFSEFAATISTQFGDSSCYSGVFQAFPDADLTGALQIAEAWNTGRWPRNVWSATTLKIQRAPGTEFFYKFVWTMPDLEHDEFVNLLAGSVETSHRCNWSRCINPRHLVLENHAINMNRVSCFKYVQQKRRTDAPVPQFCDTHDPPCLLQASVGDAKQRVIQEYRLLTGTSFISPLQPQFNLDPGMVANIRMVTEDISLFD